MDGHPYPLEMARDSLCGHKATGPPIKDTMYRSQSHGWVVKSQIPFLLACITTCSPTWSTDPDRPKFKTTGGALSYGKQLKFPDDYFFTTASLSYQRYTLKDWTSFGSNEIGFTNGFSNNLSLTLTLGRNSTNQPIYPTEGSDVSLSWQVTPPYSAFSDKDYSTLSAQERFKWIELRKTKFDAKWYLGFPHGAKRQFVFAPAVRYGGITIYDQSIGYSPFEQFQVGGSGLSNFVLYGTDIVAQRGYDDRSVSNGGVMPFFTKYTLELRYPITTSQSSTIYIHSFLEAGNAYPDLKNFNPFELKRAGGVGVRLFLPMFGLLGFDFAWPFDGGQMQTHFMIGQQF